MLRVIACASLSLILSSIAKSDFRIDKVETGLDIYWDSQRIAEYRHGNPETPRPYFSNIHSLDGKRLTRSFPPVAGVDPTDHDKLHPGVWLAFGNLNGVDFWRNKGKVTHVRYIVEPTISNQGITFSTEENYVAPSGQNVCRAINEYRVDRLSLAPHQAFVLKWKTQLKSDTTELTFGDQHEMGLGFRVATPISVKHGRGTISSNHGGKNEKGNWGRVGSWWDYSATNDNQRLGILAIAATNPRPIWVHARDYGFIALNPTGVPDRPEDSLPAKPFHVPKGEAVEFSFALVFYSTDASGAWDSETASKQAIR
jgi:hypothetical protein